MQKLTDVWNILLKSQFWGLARRTIKYACTSLLCDVTFLPLVGSKKQLNTWDHHSGWKQPMYTKTHEGYYQISKDKTKMT